MKEEYRKKYLNIRNKISNRQYEDETIYKQVINNDMIKNCELLLVYVSVNSEVDTIRIINYFLKYKKVAVPKIENNTMNFYYINSVTELVKGYFDILEPSNDKLVTNFDSCVSITPGICFSHDLYRIGYGKGYYDKFYQKYPNIYKIGLAYRDCYLTSIPHDNYDIKLDDIIVSNELNL